MGRGHPKRNRYSFELRRRRRRRQLTRLVIYCLLTLPVQRTTFCGVMCIW